MRELQTRIGILHWLGVAVRPKRGMVCMRYLRPESFQAAAQALYDEKGLSRILAGGTDVLVQLKSEIVEPDLLVDLKHLDGMREIIAENGG